MPLFLLITAGFPPVALSEDTIWRLRNGQHRILQQTVIGSPGIDDILRLRRVHDTATGKQTANANGQVKIRATTFITQEVYRHGATIHLLYPFYCPLLSKSG